MSIKAVHFEIMSNLSSEGFLAALRRFVARRGLPQHVYSDNGTNFVGANNQLKEIYSIPHKHLDEHKEAINKYSSKYLVAFHTTWRPPFWRVVGVHRKTFQTLLQTRGW